MLLEMVRYFFLKYNYYSIWSNDIILGTKKRKTLLDESDLLLGGIISIPWFEFCLVHLIPEFKRYGIAIDYWFMTLPQTHMQWPKEYNHPVDYLYFNFLKIKND